jgi:hypothetical protein
MATASNLQSSTQTIAQLLSKNPLYLATEAQMNTYLSAYLNDESFRRSVRTKRPSEDAALWLDCIKHTVAQPIARWVVETINHTVFEPGVTRELKFVSEGGGDLPESMTDWSELFTLDADLQNNNMNGVMEHIAQLSSIFGMCWVFVDLPQDGGDINPQLGVRPYVVPVSPQYVWDWQFIAVRGVNIPSYIKVLERETEDCYYFKCYWIGTATTPSYWQCYQVEKRDLQQSHKILQPMSEGVYPLGMTIPGFMTFTRRDPRRFELGISDIDVATNVQMEHYKLECDAYQALQFARTLIRAEQGIKVPATAGGIVRAAEGQIETLSVDTGDVSAIIAKQADLLENYQNLSGLGGISASKKQVQSGVSIIEERRGLYRLAQSKARMMEVCEEMIWSYASRFMNIRWSGEVVYGTDYDSTDTTYRIALYKEAKALAPDNPVIEKLIVEQLVKMIAPQDDVEEWMDMLKEQKPEAEEEEEETPAQERSEHLQMDITDMLPDAEQQQYALDRLKQREENTTTAGGVGIRNTGVSMYPTESAAAMVLNTFSGGGR